MNNENTMYDGFRLHKMIEEAVMSVLNKNKLLNATFTLGHVDQVVSQSKLRVFVNGSETSQLVSCNPDITFSAGDHVVIANLSRNVSNDKFVISRRIVQ